MEFNLIEKYFKPLTSTGRGAFYLGDDGAVIPPYLQGSVAKDLVVVTDTLVEGVHFYSDMPSYDLGWKSLAVNLSDLAAMGAKPAFYSLALTLPEINETWLQGFTEGLKALSDKFGVVLVGGDTTSGKELAITITAQGWVEQGKALLRSGAQIGDDIYVSGFIGDSGFGLAKWGQNLNSLEQEAVLNFSRPEPRVELGQKLVGLASSCIDVSDGLLADLNHILQASKYFQSTQVGGCLDFSAIPVRDVVKTWAGADKLKPLTAGEDFELCFTASLTKAEALAKLAKEFNFVKIGRVVEGSGINLDGTEIMPSKLGYQHFS